jgi:hypothetical protein
MPSDNIIPIGVFSIKHVHFYISVLSTQPLRPTAREELQKRCSGVKCAGCGMPVLEHEYDVDRDIVLHWTANCAIVRNKKTP